MTDDVLGKAQIPIRATLDKLDGDLAECRKKMEGSLGDTLKSIGDKVGQIGSAVVLGAVAAVTGAIVGIGTAAFSSAMQLDDAYDGIMVKTGATGAALQGLQRDFRAVFQEVPADAETVSGVLAELNTRLGATGGTLRSMTEGLVESARLMGGDATQSAVLLSKTMASWGLTNEQGKATLDMLFTATQKSGIGMDQLMTSVQQNGAVLRTMGFSLNDSVAMMASFEKAGLESSQVMAGMKIAAGKFAKAQQDTTETIKGGVPSLAKAGDQLGNLREQLRLATIRQSEFTDKTKASTKAAAESKIHKLTKQITDLEGAMAKGESRTITVAGSNKTLHDSLMGTFDAIKNDTDATHALSVGMEVFGARSAPAMVDAIRSGKLELGSMIAALEKSEDAIANTAAATEDWPEKWAKLKNVATVALAPIGTALMDIAGKVMDAAGPALEKLAGIIESDVVPMVENVILAIETMIAGDWDAPWEELFPPWIADTIKTVIATVQEVFTFIQENLPEIQAAVGVVLVGAFMAWAYSAGAAAIATLTAMAPITLVIIGITAAVALLAAAWAGDWGGIRTALTAFWENTGRPIFEQVSKWLSVNIPAAIATVSQFWTGTLQPALNTVWGFIQGSIIPIFNTVVGWLGTNIPNAVATVSSAWNGPFMTAIKGVWDFLSVNVIKVFTTVRDWLQTNIPAATNTLSNLWTGTLKPALETVWSFLEVYVIPIFKDLVDIYILAISLAVTALAALWENILKPALEKVWNFIVISVIPIFTDLVGKGLDLVKTATETLARIWDKTLKPALEKVAAVLKDPVLPILKDVAAFINDTLGKAVIWLSDKVFGGLTKAIDGIKQGLQWLIDRLNDLKDLIANIKLPSWLDPGSPTPLELGIIGINDALRVMNRLWGEMASQPMMRMGAVMPAMPSQPTLGGLPLGERVTVEVNGNGAASTSGNTYNLAVTYKETESESDLYHTVRMLQLMET